MRRAQEEAAASLSKTKSLNEDFTVIKLDEEVAVIPPVEEKSEAEADAEAEAIAAELERAQELAALELGLAVDWAREAASEANMNYLDEDFTEIELDEELSVIPPVEEE
eukprot:1612111-Pyramimonas_sp.AAC.1